VGTARDAAIEAGAGESVIVTESTGGSGRTLRVQTESLQPSDSAAVATSLAEACETSLDEVSVQVVGPSWGEEITNKAVTGLAVFLVLIVVYLSLTFEWKMAVAAIVALLHDVVITVGVYALIGFEVTPATVIGVLTILGYSLYDTVIVFDKVKENTQGLAGGSRMTYSQAANLAVNQTLVRSINTTVIALLPVAAILFGGAYLLGAGTLKDLALALFVGMAAGAYSSIFIATPVLANLKEREPAMQALAKRVAARQGSAAKQPAARGSVLVDDGDGPAADGAAESEGEAPSADATPPSRPTGGTQRQQPKRQQPKRRPGGPKR
jgi:preprotein translocase subunit SecF